MFNGVLLVAIIATLILKVTSLPKLYYQWITSVKAVGEIRWSSVTTLAGDLPLLLLLDVM